MGTLEKPLKSYIQAVKRLLTCPKSYRSGFLADMEHDIRQFLLENGSVSYPDLICNFGTPQELAKLYLENVPPEELATYASQRKRNAKIIYIFLIITITIVSCLYFNYKEEHALDVIESEEYIEIIK